MRRVITYESTASEQVLAAIKKLGKGSLAALLGTESKGERGYKFQKAAQRLRKRNLIFGERKGRRVVFELTDEGKKEAAKIMLKFEMAKKKKWDGKWRIFIFDVPEKIRSKRDLLRKELINFGFMQLQKSVWAYPYLLPKEFLNLWEETGLLKHCIIIEASKVENSDRPREFFFPKRL